MVDVNSSVMDMGELWPVSTGLPQSAGVRHHGHLLLALVHIVLALWAWLVNGTQIATLLQDRKLRGQPRSALMVSISVAEVVVAGVLCPLYTDSLVRGPWRHGLLVCSIYELLFYLQVCVSSVAVLVFNVERFYFMAAPHLLQSPARRRHATAVLTSLPWLMGVLAVVPLFTQGTRASMEHVPGLHHRTCVMQWDRTLHVVTVFVAFLAPSFLLLLTAVSVLLLYVLFSVRAHEPSGLQSAAPSVPPDPRWTHTDGGGSMNGGSCTRSGRRRRRRHFSGTMMQELDGRLKKECVLSVGVSTFLTVGLQFPIFTLLLLQRFCQHPPPQHHASSPQSPAYSFLPEISSDCQFSDTAWATCMMLIMAKPGLLPLAWLFYSDLRAAFRPCWGSPCLWGRSWRSSPRSSSGADGPGSEDCSESGEAYCTRSQRSLASQMTVV